MKKKILPVKKTPTIVSAPMPDDNIVHSHDCVGSGL